MSRYKGGYTTLLKDAKKHCSSVDDRLIFEFSYSTFWKIDSIIKKYTEPSPFNKKAIETPFSDEDIDELIEKSKGNTAIIYFFIFHYKFPLSSPQIDALIDNTLYREVGFILHRDDVKPHHIKKIVEKYENTSHKPFSIFLNKFADKINKDVIEYFVLNMPEKTQYWRYEPYAHIESSKLLPIIEQELKTNNDEMLLSNIVNNTSLSNDIRNKAFKKGAMIEKIQNPTEEVAKEIYSSAIQTAYDKDIDITTAEESLNMILKIINFLPPSYIIDFLNQLEQNDYFEHIRYEIAKNTKDDAVLYEFLKNDKYPTTKGFACNSPYIGELSYNYIKNNPDKLFMIDESKIKRCFLYFLNNNKNVAPHYFDAYINSIPRDENFIKAILVHPNTPDSILEKIQSLNIPEYNVILDMREYFNREDGYQNLNQTLVQHYVISTMKDNPLYISSCNIEDFYKTTSNLEKLKRKNVESFTTISTEILSRKNLSQEIKINIKNFIKKITKSYQENKFFAENTIGCIESTNNKDIVPFKFSYEKLNEFTNKDFDNAIDHIKTLSKKECKRLKEIILDGLETPNVHKYFAPEEFHHKVYKVVNLYNEINKRLLILKIEKQKETVKDDISDIEIESK